MIDFINAIPKSLKIIICAVGLSIALIGFQTPSLAQDIDDEFLEFEFEYNIDDLIELDTLDALDGLNEDEMLDEFEFDIEQGRLEDAINEWIIIADASELNAIRGTGIAIDRVELLQGLGLVIARIQIQGNLSLSQTQTLISRVAPSAEIDLNHIYRPNSDQQDRTQKWFLPRALFPMPEFQTGAGHKIGIIDTKINTKHPALKDLKITSKDFVTRDLSRPTDHGTAIISILGGNGENYKGLLPDAHYFTASVFYTQKKGGRTATTDSLVRAINWMKENDVPIINMSLTGPPNRVLERVIEATINKNTVIVAAIGNAGPNAPPLYPAAYTDVIGVTAVSKSKKIYRLAGRGTHVDFSAPGVRVRHADSKNGFSTSSGTSMAAPFVTATIIVNSSPQGLLPATVFEKLKLTAEDLGAKGFDTTYGNGLVQPTAQID